MWLRVGTNKYVNGDREITVESVVQLKYKKKAQSVTIEMEPGSDRTFAVYENTIATWTKFCEPSTPISQVEKEEIIRDIDAVFKITGVRLVIPSRRVSLEEALARRRAKGQ